MQSEGSGEVKAVLPGALWVSRHLHFALTAFTLTGPGATLEHLVQQPVRRLSARGARFCIRELRGGASIWHGRRVEPTGWRPSEGVAAP